MKKISLIVLIVTCVLQSIAQGDCPPSAICANGTGITAAGLIPELNSGNQGCLIGEAPRTSWLSICFTSNGIFRFALTPGGGANNDMDWVMWGPNSICPPTTSPIRCSYAAVPLGGPKITGINSVNNAPQTDVSESALGNQWVQDLNVSTGQCYLICVSNYGGGNNNWAINFNGTTASMLCSALPIELLYFVGERTTCGENVLLWETATETNNDKFIVEHSLDAINFTVIGEKQGSGNSMTNKKYSLTDANPSPELNYYRLKQVDFNGEFNYSSITSIDNSCDKNVTTIKIVNLLGQEVDENYRGVVLIYRSDNTIKKKTQIN